MPPVASMTAPRVDLLELAVLVEQMNADDAGRLPSRDRWRTRIREMKCA